MSELKPCPFCGGEAQVARTAAGYWAAYCEEPMCGRVGNFKTEAEAIEAWNTRAGCDNCAALNKAAGLWAKADKRARELEQSIVRCRDCKRMRDWTAEEELASYDKEELADGWCMFLRIGTYDDFFCSWGVRKVSE